MHDWLCRSTWSVTVVEIQFISIFSSRKNVHLKFCYNKKKKFCYQVLNLVAKVCYHPKKWISRPAPPSRPVLRVLLWQPPLRQVVPDAIQPPSLWSSSPSFPRHLHPHHSLPYALGFSSRNMPIPLQPTLLHFLGYANITKEHTYALLKIMPSSWEAGVIGKTLTHIFKRQNIHMYLWCCTCRSMLKRTHQELNI